MGKFFGQCNQENLIWESLTVDESMNFVASLKGIHGERRERVKSLIMETLELNYFKETLSKNLSGGNKRKLCCAQALMLCPKVLFLDEPTSGVDPVSRRSLNRMIKKMKMSSVLLTTHRMDEAEQLCDRLAIMINGRFVVFGTPNYLKTQYG
jgi:ATP-binding cassette subfamily A (ABC1) protein 3|mmetsp:Transcript_16268/g.22017  ORF Transcript_16268/g.22017 Transcript_16268/m.22017 type:complete len:152 (+) Transcript_16268:1721-2176(+)